MENSYSVFYDSRKIQFLGKGHQNNGVQQLDGEQQLTGEKLIVGKEGLSWEDFLAFIASGQSSLSVIGDHPARLFRRFATNFFHIDAAGGLVEDPTGYWLFIYRRACWDLPKGMLEEGESAEMAALREVEEECGIERLEIIHPLPHTYHVYPLKDDQWALKRTQWFYMKTLRCCQAEPQTSEGISMAAWKSPGDLHDVMENTYRNIKELIETCLKLKQKST